MPDQDRLAVVAGLRQAVTASGLSQADFARATGTSPSRFSTYVTGRTVPAASLYLRASRLAMSFRRVREHSWLTPVAAANAMRTALADGDQVWALRMALQCRDHVKAALLEPDRRLADAWDGHPGSTGVERFDRLLEALVGHEFDERRRPAPDWTGSRATSGPWLFVSPFFTDNEVRASTPSWLRERGIFISARDLDTA